jgi:CO/xanthine dehydrogenase Mo-binding subunit
VALARFTGADDFGRIVNPMIVEGQVHGAVVRREHVDAPAGR